MNPGCASGFYLHPGYLTAESWSLVDGHLRGVALALVGERGPELVNLPRGKRVRGEA